MTFVVISTNLAYNENIKREIQTLNFLKLLVGIDSVIVAIAAVVKIWLTKKSLILRLNFMDFLRYLRNHDTDRMNIDKLFGEKPQE